MKIAIFGRKKDTENYEKYVAALPAVPVATLDCGELASCDALLLPGGGDITPAFFGERNNGSGNIDTELDILQFQAVDCALRRSLPILGICKGMQVINVSFGGTIIQDLPTASLHRYQDGDQYHPTVISANCCLHECFGGEAVVNSAHHQSVGTLGSGLIPVQWCPLDGCVEAVVHEHLPVLGLQWHPERLDAERTPVRGDRILALLAAWIRSPGR